MKPRSSISIQSDHCGTGVEPEQGSVSADPVVRRALQRIINEMEVNPHARQDLLQEALAYFWSREKDFPVQRLAWYLRGVRFHLQDIRASGRGREQRRAEGHRGEGGDSRETAEGHILKLAEPAAGIISPPEAMNGVPFSATTASGSIFANSWPKWWTVSTSACMPMF